MIGHRSVLDESHGGQLNDVNRRFITQLDVTVTVTEALVLRLLEDRGRINESIRILVPVDRMNQKCFQITTKQVRRSQQFQLRR